MRPRRSPTWLQHDSGVLEATYQYGVYHGSRLTYHAKHYLAADPAEWRRLGPSNTKQKTGEDGKATFHDAPSGLVGFVASVPPKKQDGEVDGVAYTTASHFATVTFPRSGAGLSPEDVSMPTEERRPTPEASDDQRAADLELPSALSSFGAAVSDGYLYVYGGHIGTAHSHSRDNLSRSFARISFDPGSAWEELPFQTAVQGLALVAHDGMIYQIGGMTAKNAADEDADLHSTSDFRRFDPASKTWESLTPLPHARSSHDAVVIGDKLYVVGGWTLSQGNDAKWRTESLEMDLTAGSGEWQELPKQPFTRRALAAGSLQGKLIVIGGIDSGGDVSRDVDVFDPANSQWSKGTPYPGEGMHGFGVSAWNLAGRLYVSGSDGVVYCLGQPTRPWEPVGQLAQPRFFHQLLPGPHGALLAVGGAASEGHLRSVERFKPPSSFSKPSTLADP